MVLLVHNEVEVIDKVVSSFYEVFSYLPEGSEFIIAEDGSTDGTKEKLSKWKGKAILSMHPAKKGYEKARNDALKLAKNDLIFISDGDGQHDPFDFFYLYDEIEKGADLVVGYKSERQDPFYRIICSRLANLFNYFFYGLKLHDANCGFRIYKKKVVKRLVDKVSIMPFTGNMEFAIRAKRVGFNVTECPIHHYHRTNRPGFYTPKKIPKMIFQHLKGMIRLRADL